MPRFAGQLSPSWLGYPLFVLICVHLCSSAADSGDWAFWRGPEQRGVSLDTGLPDKFSLDPKDPDSNLIWKAPYGCRSTPVVMNGRVYLIGAVGERAVEIQERVVCLDADTGKKVWEHRFNVFHTDIVTSRVGWTNPVGDPTTGNIYVHGVQGLFFCFDKDGKIRWQRSLTEEYGRITGYGGRVTSPIVDEDLVIIGMLNSSWGDQGKGGNRFLAMNKNNGEVVWWSEPGGPPKDTYYSVPVVAEIKGQRLLISGGGDGGVYAMKVRTGEPVWTYSNLGTGAINSSPVVDGNLVYIGQGEENPDNNLQGRVVCLDAGDVKDGEPKLIWKRDGLKARYASPIFHQGRLYIPDDLGRLICLDGQSGKTQWRHTYGQASRGSPVWADGKIYVAEVHSKFHILKPGPMKCDSLHEQFFPSPDGTTDVEINGSPAVANGRVYFATSEEFYCIGTKNGKSSPPAKSEPAQTTSAGKVAHLQIVPADLVLAPGESALFKLLAFDEQGHLVKEIKSADWALPTPPVPEGKKSGPPALKGDVTDGKVTVAKAVSNQQGYVVAKAEGLIARARVRVAPLLPYQEDFEKYADGAVPGGWVNTQGKFYVAKLKDGTKVLKKVNDKASPLIARGNAYIGMPSLKDYTIEADVLGGKVGDDLPDMGVVASRYTLFLTGNIQKLRIVSWDALPRVDRTISFPWKADAWYRLKLTVEQKGKQAVVRGKVWPRDQQEPAQWTLSVTDPRPNTEGSPGLYGYVTGIPEEGAGTEIWYDNVRIVPNGK
jgi:outer membrane protein assembly factor BamB